MPPRVPGLDSQEHLWPRQIEVDQLAGRQVDGVLPDGLRQPAPADRRQEVVLQTALARSGAGHRSFQPSLEAGDAGSSLAADQVQVRDGVQGRRQAVVPHVLGRSLEAVVVERRSQRQQHRERFEDAEAPGLTHVGVEVEPRVAVDRHPAGQRVPPTPDDGGDDRADRHPAQSEQPPGRGSAEDTVGLDVQLDRHRPGLEGLGVGARAEHTRQYRDERAALTGVANRPARDSDGFELAARHDAVLGREQRCDSRMFDHTRPGRRPAAEAEPPADQGQL